MIRRCLIILCSIFALVSAKASHIIGGEVSYTYLSYDPATDQFTYRVTVKLYRDCNSAAVIPNNIDLNIYNTATNLPVRAQTLGPVVRGPVFTSNTISCISNPTNVCYEVGTYIGIVVLDRSNDGYTIFAQSCCRVFGLQNVNAPGGSQVGATYVAYIPPHNLAAINSSPFTMGDSVKVICTGIPASFKFDIQDADGDSLAYSFCDAYTGGTTITVVPPPFSAVPYANGGGGGGYSGNNPMGGSPPALSINPETGVISGTVTQAGSYVVAICVQEYRNGVRLNEYRKEFQFQAQLCEPPIAPGFVECKSLTVQFVHANDPTFEYFWDFGVPTLLSDTSKEVIPSYTFPAPGTYDVTMRIRRGANCTDVFRAVTKVYPLFEAHIQLPPPPLCSGGLLTFRDSTRIDFGLIDSLKWYDISAGGGLVSTGPTCGIIYPTPGDKTLQLIASSTLGCRDTTERTFNLLSGPALNAGPDFSICEGDTSRLNATSDASSFTWSPPTGLDNPNSLNPKVFPAVTTKYEIRGVIGICRSIDSVEVRVVPYPVATVTASKNYVCDGDTISLNATGGSIYTWTPVEGLSDPNIANPSAHPPVSTWYKVFVKDVLGCDQPDIDSVFVKSIPKLVVKAGKDTFSLRGDPVQLQVTGAPFYTWTPVNATLNDLTSNRPIAFVNDNAVFYVRGYTAEGCEGRDTIKLTYLYIDPDIYVPTAFTPNGDGINSTIKPIGLGVEYVEYFSIFNRWGQQVFFTKQYNRGWDGRVNGSEQPAGAYVWTLRARDFKGKLIVKKGSFVLIR
jgi:gliding motility-associated-like protein